MFRAMMMTMLLMKITTKKMILRNFSMKYLLITSNTYHSNSSNRFIIYQISKAKESKEITKMSVARYAMSYGMMVAVMTWTTTMMSASMIVITTHHKMGEAGTYLKL